jgi:hypothetical protein
VAIARTKCGTCSLPRTRNWRTTEREASRREGAVRVKAPDKPELFLARRIERSPAFINQEKQATGKSSAEKIMDHKVVYTAFPAFFGDSEGARIVRIHAFALHRARDFGARLRVCYHLTGLRIPLHRWRLSPSVKALRGHISKFGSPAQIDSTDLSRCV